MTFPAPDHDRLRHALDLPTGRIRAVLDTDTYNEVDDQFAVAHAVLAPERFDLEAIYAAPFHNDRSTGPDQGMELSFDEILRVLERLDTPAQGLVHEGSRSFLPAAETPVDSPAAQDLVRRAIDGEGTLYVMAIGAITNVASALLIEPKIAERIVVVWLGGMPYWLGKAHEFNLSQDLHASRVMFDSGVPLIQVPTIGVTSHLLTTMPELEAHLEPLGEIGRFLTQRVREYTDDTRLWSKEIWDIGVTGAVIDPSWAPSEIVPSPILGDNLWTTDPARHPIRIVTGIRRDAIFRDLFDRIARFAL